MDLQLGSSGFTEDSLKVWRDIACDLFVPLQIDPMGKDPFRWDMYDTDFGDISLTDLSLSPQDVQRSNKHIGGSSTDYFLLSVQVEGMATIAQDGRHVRLAPGDGVLYDTKRPYMLVFEHDMRQHILRVPRDMLLSAIPGMNDAVARRISGTFSLGALLGSTIRHYIDGAANFEPSERANLSNSLLDLLAVTIGKFDAMQMEKEPSNRVATRARIDAFIAKNLKNADLSVAMISSRTGLSIRALHRLFKATGDETLSRFITKRRLEHCAAELADPGQRKTITELCLDWGFSDSAHFSRAFRTHYGLTPREFRSGSTGHLMTSAK